MTVVGTVASLDLGWLEQRPLHGLTVAVTRARAQASELAARLRALGAEVAETPAIRIVPRPAPPELGRIEDYALVCLTSPNGAHLLLEGLAAHDRDARSLAGAVLAAIGPGTAAALGERGLRADVVPPRSVAESLVEALARVDVGGRKVLVARAAEARDVLPDALRERGAEVDVAALYETVAEPLGKEERSALERATHVTFTASSTVRFLLEALDGAGLPDRPRVVSVGPVTSATAPRERPQGGRRGPAPRHRRRGGGAGRGRRAVIVSLLTDYGADDEFAGVMHGVIAGIAPEARVVDLTHGIPRHAVRHGALVLARALPYLPEGVHVGVVDPEVGSERRALGLRTAEPERLLVGPDNGLLSLAWERFGGVVEAVDITRSPHRLEPVSATFHGRDLFAPVAAHLAAGAELADAGEAVDPDGLEAIELSEPRVEDGALVARVLSLDRYGNAALDAGHDELAGSGLTLGREVELEVGGDRHRALYVQTFADVPSGELLVYEDAYRTLAVAVNRGDAARTLGLAVDGEVRVRPR